MTQSEMREAAILAEAIYVTMGAAQAVAGECVITPATLVDSVADDSLSRYELLLAIENRLDHEIDESAAMVAETLSQLAEVVRCAIREHGTQAPTTSDLPAATHA